MDTSPTAVLPMRCSCCDARFRGHASGWRQRSTLLPDSGEQLFVHLCGKCAGWFSGESAIGDFLDAALEHALARRNMRSAG